MIKNNQWLPGDRWKKRITKGQYETFGGDEYNLSLDCGDDFTGVHICQNLPNWILHTCSVYCISIIV